jgi:hypothetical protein
MTISFGSFGLSQSLRFVACPERDREIRHIDNARAKAADPDVMNPSDDRDRSGVRHRP